MAHWAFFACAAVALLSLLVALATRDLALRSA
jgi:hypothetical protein